MKSHQLLPGSPLSPPVSFKSTHSRRAPQASKSSGCEKGQFLADGIDMPHFGKEIVVLT